MRNVKIFWVLFMVLFYSSIVFSDEISVNTTQADTSVSAPATKTTHKKKSTKKKKKSGKKSKSNKKKKISRISSKTSSESMFSKSLFSDKGSKRSEAESVEVAYQGK